MAPAQRDKKIDLACAFFGIGALGAAQKLFEEVLAADPDDHEALGGLLGIYEVLGDVGKVVEVAERMRATYPVFVVRRRS